MSLGGNELCFLSANCHIFMRHVEWPELPESTTLLLIQMLMSEEEKLAEFVRGAIDLKSLSVDLCFQIGSSSAECVETVSAVFLLAPISAN